MDTEETTVVDAPALTRHDQAKAARGAKLWTRIARLTGLALLAAVLGFGFYLAVANTAAREDRSNLILQLDENSSTSTPGPTGPTGPTGPQGVPGEDGPAPTAAEVLAAVQTYCASVGGCRGTDGTNGTNGINGLPGIPGESIVGPAGPQGDPGTPGAPGAAGVSVTGVSCVVREDLSTAFRFSFSDGQTVDVAGACLP